MKSKKRLKGLGRRIKRFLKKPKFVKLNKKLLKLKKYSMIYSVARSENPLSRDERQRLIELFQMCINVAWALLIKLKGLLIKFFKKFTMSLLKLVRNHPWFTAYVTFVSCSVLILHYLSKKFARKLRWYEYLVSIILWLILIYVLSLVIENQAFQKIIQWLKSIFISLFLNLRNINSSPAEHVTNLESNSPTIEDKPEASTAGNLKTFIFFSVITVLTTKYLLLSFKRQLVGEGPLRDIIIEIIDNTRFEDPPIKELSNVPQRI